MLATVALLSFLAIATGCNGFFVNPTLTGVTISPSNPALQSSGQSEQLTATGNFSDGSSSVITGSCSWTSSDPTSVKVSSGGMITALTSSSSTATITASCSSSSGSATGTVTVTIGQSSGGGGGSLLISSSLGNELSLTTDPAGTAVEFTATLNGQDVTAETSFVSSNPSVITVAGGGVGTVGGAEGTTTITGTATGATGSISITVGP